MLTIVQKIENPVDAAIVAERRLIDDLVLTHRFSDIEAADYLRFCREHPLPPAVTTKRKERAA